VGRTSSVDLRALEGKEGYFRNREAQEIVKSSPQEAVMRV
jgi:hypothetical protein